MNISVLNCMSIIKGYEKFDHFGCRQFHRILCTNSSDYDDTYDFGIFYCADYKDIDFTENQTFYISLMNATNLFLQ